MAIFVDQNTKVIVQGLTGGQGKYHGLRNKAYGTQVVAGVTPGKGGSDVEGIPVYNSVAEAVSATGATASPKAFLPRTKHAHTTRWYAIIQRFACLGQTAQESLAQENATLVLQLVKLQNFQVQKVQTLELFRVQELLRIKLFTN